MIEIVGTELNQWDVGRLVHITGVEAEYAHFANKGDSKAVIMGVVDIEAKIPDYLLQTGKPLCVYAVKDGITIESKTFYVKNRERPENYVYKEDQRNYIYELISNAEKAVDDANLATKNANLAAKGANASADNANAATDSANKATGSANEAAKKANDAATKAANTAKSLMVVGKADGDVIHLDDAIEQYLVGLRIFGKTTQDGVPTPDGPVVLESVGSSGNIGVAVTGKNLLNVPEFLSFTRNVNISQYLPKGTYVVSCGNVAYSGDKKPVIVFYDSDKAIFNSELPVNGEKTITITQDAYRWSVLSNGYDYNGSAGVSAAVEQLMLRPVSITESDYELYKGGTVTIQTPNGLPGIPVTTGGNYADENGQLWVCDEVDFARGVLVKRTGMVDMGTLKATLIPVSAGNLFRFEVSDIKVSMSSTVMPNILCEAYPAVRTGDRKHSTISMPVNSRNVDIINNT